jgi:midasin
MATAEEAASAGQQTRPFAWKDRPFDATILPHYLGRILRAARCLAGETGDARSIIVAPTDPSSTIHAIAQALIHACRLNVITTGALDLPAIPPHDSPHDVPIPEEYDDDEEEHVAAPYVWRRVDYLRHLLRALFPVQLDVAAAALPLLSNESAATTMILLGQWLPVAPQITPLVRTMVADMNSPLQDLSSVSELKRFTILEACHRVAAFYCRARVDYATFLHLWDWTPVFGQLSTTIHPTENHAPMQVAIDWRHWSRTQLDQATAWHAVRLAAFVLRLTPVATASYLDRHGVTRDWVPWQIHAWDTNLEEGEAQRMALLQRADIWMQGDECATPTALEVRLAVPLPLCLVDCGEGLVLVREHPLEARGAKETELVPTPTTARNLALLAAVLCMQPVPPPVLLCGPAGSGKSTLLRSLARRVGTSLLEIHVDDETDSKTLIGCTTTTEIPGRFAWRAGALTKAVREGRWVLLEDLDRVPMEIQAALVQLLEDRLLPLGNGKVERAHPNFRLFGTHGPVDTVGRKVLNAHYWAPVPLEPLTVDEMKQVAHVRYPNLPAFVVATVLGIFQQILADGRRLVGSRMPSVRDFFKVLSRISHTIPIDAGTTFATEGQRTLCLGETMDVLAAACPEVDLRRELARSLVAPAWNVTAALATAYLEKRTPSVIQHADATELGRVRLPTSNRVERGTSSNFAITGHALRFMESIAVCIRENEPVLLVGETGGGKTTLVQQLARLAGQSVMVQNLSLQTDSTDLLGGFRPLEMKHVARRVYQEFVDLFTSTFSRKQNADFLKFTNTALTKENWKKLSQCFTRACKLGLNKMKERQALGEEAHVEAWNNFVESAERFEQQRLACDSGLAFEFTEGGLVDAIRYGKWVLLDEINLASSEILQRLCGLLDSADSSIILTERGDSEAIRRHPNFRLFAAMNPATDAGKKDLAPSIRSRFTEMYVDEIVDPIELRLVAGKYIAPVLTQVDVPPEETETVVKIVDLYLQCRVLAESSLVDGGGHKPRYTLRTLSRALTAAKSMVVKQKFSLSRSLVEGFELAFQGCLDGKSSKEMAKVISGSVGDMSSDRNQPGRRPGGREGGDDFVLLKPFWISKGSNDAVDWVHESNNGLSRYVMTPSTLSNVRCLGRVIASGPWPILLEGPTSAGKTSVVEYIASRCGFTVVRINNHEHTDISEYLGSFAPDSRGSLVFQDGLLVRALREGHWVILDELNLAPSEVLEALNRLLDDNRELYLSETNEVVKAHADFRLFATQNPSGAYGGRKPLSRAFRNRFIELHVGDIPSNEMIEILEKRSGCPPSHAKVLVAVMNALRQRRSTGNLFAGKDSLITPRDLLRWADRKASSKKELAEEGYMLLAERLRTDSEKKQVLDVIEGCSKVSVDIDALYYSVGSVASQVFAGIEKVVGDEGSKQFLRRIAPTNSFLRLVTLVERCHRRKEPVLLVGGKF